MEYCGDGCIAACDWCIHFDWDTWLCDIDGEETNPGAQCDEFKCEES